MTLNVTFQFQKLKITRVTGRDAIRFTSGAPSRSFQSGRDFRGEWTLRIFECVRKINCEQTGEISGKSFVIFIGN